MEVDRKALLEALTSVTPGLGSEKTLIDQSDCVVFTGKQIVTFNDTVSITKDFKLGIKGAVKAEELMKFLKRVGTEKITIEEQDDNLLVKSGRSRAGIAMQSEILLPFKDVPKPKTMKPLQEGVVKGLSFVSFSVGKDYSRRVLTNAYIAGKRVVSSDDDRITEYKLKEKVKGKCLIPGRLIATLAAFEPVAMGVNKDWVQFQKEDGTLFSVLMDQGKYPDIDEFMEVKGPKVTFPEGLAEVLDRAEVFLSSRFDEDNLVDLSAKKGSLKVSSKGDKGWFKEELDYDGPNFSLATQPAFLKEILKSTSTAVVGEDKILFEGESFRHVATLY